LQNSWKKIPELTEKFELMEKRELNSGKEVPAPQPTPIYKLSMQSMLYGKGLGQLPGCAPPSSCTPAP